MAEMERESREYLWVPVEASWGDLDDITTVEAELTDSASTRPSSWVQVTFVDPQHEMGDQQNYYVRALIGPSGDAAAEIQHSGPNDYQVWVRLSASPESIVLREGVLTIL